MGQSKIAVWQLGSEKNQVASNVTLLGRLCHTSTLGAMAGSAFLQHPARKAFA